MNNIIEKYLKTKSAIALIVINIIKIILLYNNISAIFEMQLF